MKESQDTSARGAHAVRSATPRQATPRQAAPRTGASRSSSPRQAASRAAAGAGPSRLAITRPERRGDRRPDRGVDRVREAHVAPDRASASRPAEPRERAASRKTIDVAGFFSAIGDFVINFRVLVVAVVVLLALIVTMYGPAQTYYKAWRSGLELQSQLDELNASNEQYKSDIQSLQTREGIEDEARKRGYVSEGETKVVVEGTSENDEGTDAGTSDSASELPWYIQLGDTVFHYVS